MVKKDSAQAPLTPAVLPIQLELSMGEWHFYGIMKQVASVAEGRLSYGD